MLPIPAGCLGGICFETARVKVDCLASPASTSKEARMSSLWRHVGSRGGLRRAIQCPLVKHHETSGSAAIGQSGQYTRDRLHQDTSPAHAWIARTLKSFET